MSGSRWSFGKGLLTLLSGKGSWLTAIACVSVVGLSASAPPAGPPAAGTDSHSGRLFTISGVTTTLLTPDITAPVELRLTNPNKVGLTITTLTVQIGDIRSSPGSGPCTAENFTVRQFSGNYGFVIGASRTTSIRDLGIAIAQWPQLTMLDLPVNQDACKNATLALEVTGQAAA